MKKFALLLSFVVVAGAAFAEEPKAAAAEKAPATAVAHHKAIAGKTHEVAAEVVSADTAKNTLTIKGEKGDTTVPVEGAKAKASLKAVQPGEKVTLTCRDNAKGEHKAVTAIVPAAPATK